jgi:hypothetical protein
MDIEGALVDRRAGPCALFIAASQPANEAAVNPQHCGDRASPTIAIGVTPLNEEYANMRD